jgi:hypothetical protein
VEFYAVVASDFFAALKRPGAGINRTGRPTGEVRPRRYRMGWNRTFCAEHGSRHGDEDGMVVITTQFLTVGPLFLININLPNSGTKNSVVE